MKKTVITVIAILLFFVIVIVAWLYPGKRYPVNEWQSRHDCKTVRLIGILSSLEMYLKSNEGKMPLDLYELVEKGYIDKSGLICPHQYERLLKGGYLDENCSLFISSYRLLVPKKIIANIPNGTIVVQENKGNHPQSYVNKVKLPKGYHVIIKKNDMLSIDFIENN